MSLNTNFVHLRLHSEYSIVDGAVRIDDAITAVVKDQMGALALTDLSNVFGLVKFYQAARKEGIKPIIGSDVWITNAEDRDKPFRLQLLVKNHQGYLNLCELLTKASLTNQFKGRSEIDETWFKQHAEGLIALSGARLGDVGQHLLAGQHAEALVCAKKWANYFKDSFYIYLNNVYLHYLDKSQNKFNFNQNIYDENMEELLKLDLNKHEAIYVNNLNYEWCGGNTHVVICGDMIDPFRSEQMNNNCLKPGGFAGLACSYYPQIELKILMFINSINTEASRFGGKIVKLLGNHELSNIINNPDIGYNKNFSYKLN